MNKLFHNIRFYILSLSILFSLGVYLFALQTFSGSLLTIRLTQVYALTALAYLYLALLAGPFCYTFPDFPFKSQCLKARRALGVSTFYFALLHASLAFFGQLGGFPGLQFLSNTYLLAISLSFIALLILSAMAATSFDKVITKMKFRNWKLLHRFVYLAGMLILIHALMLGTHFAKLSEVIPQIVFVACFFLFFLEAQRLDAFLKQKIDLLPNFGIVTALVISVILFYAVSLFTPSGGTPISLGIHAQHILLAQQAQQQTQWPTNINTAIPGLSGDRTKRFTVSFLHDDVVAPSQDTDLKFQVFDASSGNRIQLFRKIYEKNLHLIIVDQNLEYFTHIHPDQTEDGFIITTQFPHDGIYHLYLNFQPFGAIEQQFAFTISVGTGISPTKNSKPSFTKTKTFGDYVVSLSHPTPLVASQISLGTQKMTFTLKDKKTGKPVTDLKPYLAAFGHLVMINEKTFDYIHVHPTNLVAPKPDQNGGPTVEFLPLGLYGPIKPGIYRMFAQFNPNNKLFTSNFTVTLQ